MLPLRKEYEKIKKELGFSFEKEKEEKFLSYLGYLLEYNKKINLTAFKDLEELLKFQSFDFFPLLKINLNNILIDIGAGAGFLSVPLSIFLNDKEVIALEPNKKKSFFLSIVRHKLSLNFKIVEKRLEESLDEIPEKKVDFLIKALPKKEKVVSFLFKKIKNPHRLIYFAGKNFCEFKKGIKMWYSFKEMVKIPLRENSYILIFENVSCETWGKL